MHRSPALPWDESGKRWQWIVAILRSRRLS